MAVSVVNGYVCFSSCDVAAAKQGKDPNAPPGALPGDTDKKTNGLSHRPVTILDGALKDLANAVNPSSDAGTTNGPPQPLLNVVA
jgi:hypothetical protein